MMQFALMVVIAVAGIVVLLVLASRTSIARAVLPRAVTDVLSKLLPSALITSAVSTAKDEFEIAVTTFAKPVLVHVRRSDGMTFAWTYDPDANVPENGAFAFTKFHHNLRPGSLVSPADVEARVRAPIEAALRPKKFLQADAEAADLHIGVFNALEDEVTIDTIDAAFDRPDGHDWAAALAAALQSGSVGETSTFGRGSLVVDVIDARTYVVLWHAVAIADIVVDAGPAEQERRTREAINGMLQHFPPSEQDIASSRR
jgi:hypothetical protein